MAESNHKLALVAALVLAITLTPSTYAQGFSEQDLDRFRGLTEGELLAASLRFKFVPLVRREDPTFVFVVKEPGGAPQDTVPDFEIEVTRDSHAQQVFSLKPTEMRGLLDATRSCEAVRRPSMSADSLFFVDLRAIGNGRPLRYRAPLTADEMKALWIDLISSAPKRSGLRRVLAKYGSAMGFVGESELRDQSDQVRVELSGFRPVRGTDEYVGTVTVTSVADSAMPAPVSLVFWPYVSGAELVGPSPTGYTVYWDLPYFDLPVGDRMEPGEAVTLNVRYLSRGRTKMVFRHEVYAGAGER